MRDLKKQEQTAIKTVAKEFSAAWEDSTDSADAYIKLAGKRIAVNVTTLKRRGAGNGETVPNGTTVLLTITAPILAPAKTASSLEDKIKALLKRKSPGRNVKDTVHGNRVRPLKNQSEQVRRCYRYLP